MAWRWAYAFNPVSEYPPTLVVGGYQPEGLKIFLEFEGAMSVPKSQQTESHMQFLETGRNLYKAVMVLCTKLPKRYTFYIGRSIYECARDGYRHVKAANSVYPTNRHEAQLRRDHLTEANAAFDFLLSELDIVRTMGGADTALVIPVVDMIMSEQRLISKLKSSDAARYKNLPDS